MSMIKDFKDLIVWQKAMRLAREVYTIARQLPIEEKFALADQIRRSAVSIPSNIAEGQSRGTSKDFIHFLHIARGSNAELMTQYLICVNLKYFTMEELQNAIDLCDEVERLLCGLIKRLRLSAIANE